METIMSDVARTTTTVSITADERARESTLRRRFTEFWGSASGEPRAIYDIFIAGSPLVADVAADAVEENNVRGWWLRPGNMESSGKAILFLHGGGYVMGS